MVTDDQEMFKLDNLGSEVVGGACRMAERGYVSEMDVWR
jgi:hypothetical protein